MTRISDEPGKGAGSAAHRTTTESTWGERVFVLAGFGFAALYTAVSLVLDTGQEATGPLWLAAIAWTVFASLACALRRGIVDGDWSAFHGHALPDGWADRIAWSTRTGAYTYMRIAEEHERLMHGH